MSVRVISYRRCSSRRQIGGDSIRRQDDAAAAYCRKHNLTLDEDFILEDLGVSAFSGANIRDGTALSALVSLCQSGELKHGTILLIEAFDRLTRLPLPDAFGLVLALVNSGLTIVTLTDEKSWDRTALSRIEDFILSLSTIFRGHQESERKSGMLRDAFKAKRAEESNQPFGSAPGWLLRKNKFSPWEVDEAKALAVRRVFELSASGLGSKAIAGIANQEQWPVPTRLALTGKRWHAQMPGQLLRNRAVLGEHEFRIRTHEANAKHWRGLATEQVVANFYPRIVPDELWYRSRASIATRSVARRRDSHGFNIWSGLMFCGHCGAPLHRKSESRGQSRATIACSDRLANITKCPSFSASNVDEVLLERVFRVSPTTFDTSKGKDFLAEAAALEAKEQEVIEELASIEEFVVKVGKNIDSMALRHIKATDVLTQVRADIASLREAQVVTADDYALAEEFLALAVTHLYTVGPESRVVRAQLHLKLARLVEHIWVWGYDLAIVEWRGADWRTVIPLRHKGSKSRANPESKHHKPPPIRVVAEGGPFHALLSKAPEEFEPPMPQRRNAVTD